MRDDPIQQPLCHIQKLSDDQLKAIQDAVYVGMTPKVSCWKHGGASRDRTDDLIVANDALSQLSYSPTSKESLKYFNSVPSSPTISAARR
jgi:hypothetical protein